jgi:integrase
MKRIRKKKIDSEFQYDNLIMEKKKQKKPKKKKTEKKSSSEKKRKTGSGDEKIRKKRKYSSVSDKKTLEEKVKKELDSNLHHDENENLKNVKLYENLTYPEKSKQIYQKKQKDFVDWMKENDYHEESESTYIHYFNYLNNYGYSSSTIQQIFGILNKRSKIMYNQPLQSFQRLQGLMKEKHKRHIYKKSSTLSFEEIEQILQIGINEGEIFLYAIMVIIQFYGLLRVCQLREIRFKDVTLLENGKDGNEIQIKTKGVKTTNEEKVFLIKNQKAILNICNYIALFDDIKKDENLLFFKPYKEGKILANSNIGKDTYSNAIKKVVAYIGLDQKITSHGVRRSGATILAENGATVSQLKDIGGWKSDSVVQHYINSTRNFKRATAILFEKKQCLQKNEEEELKNEEEELAFKNLKIKFEKEKIIKEEINQNEIVELEKDSKMKKEIQKGKEIEKGTKNNLKKK